VAIPRADLVQGTLEMLILKVLSWGRPMHGFGVARWIEQVTDDRLTVEEGALYPALHRMRRRGWVEAEWGITENNRRARYYRITRKGRKQLRDAITSWESSTAAVAQVLEAERS
jgi:PadR family transcriptional regulator PadR